MEAVLLLTTEVHYDPVTDVLTTRWRPFRPCKVGELEDDLERAMVPPPGDGPYHVGVEFEGYRSEKLQTVVPKVIRFHGLQHWPEVSSFWLTTSMAPFRLLVSELNVDSPSLAHVFAMAHRRYVLGKPLLL